MAIFLGLDTSNYTTSCAVYESGTKSVLQEKKLLPVPAGAIGLKQSDAVFHHVRQCGELMERLTQELSQPFSAIGVSVRPRNQEGSYMPCFLVGRMVAQTLGAVLKLPVYSFSHQCGHLAAALLSIQKPELFSQPFLAFHFSGGTSECLLAEPSQEGFTVKILGQSLDLKAGQAIDRVGQMLGLGFPAGKEMDELSLHSSKKIKIRPTFQGMDCCLSGLENQCAKKLQNGEAPEDIARFCIETIQAVVQTMTEKAQKAYPDFPVVYAGGVMSNRLIRRSLEGSGRFFADPQLSSDNAAGVAALAALKEGSL